MSNRKRKIPKIIRLDESENVYIKQKVSTSGLGSFEAYARAMLIQGEVNHIDYKHLKDLTIEVNRIGTNINQVTKLANQFSEISSEDIRNLTQQINQLIYLVENKFKEELKKNI